jgi:uncharacterized protein with HEPN domain
MLDAARDATTFAKDRQRGDLTGDRQLLLALLKCLEIVGEAASRVAPETRDSIPDVPWAAIIGMRNRLIHAYYDVDIDLVWTTVQRDVPSLIAALERVAHDRA